VAAGAECDACLVGRWQLNNASYLTHLNALASSQSAGTPLQYTTAEGAAFIEFGTDGVARQSYEDMRVKAALTMENLEGESAPLELGINMSGSGRAEYAAAENELAYTSSDFRMDIETTFMGQPMQAPLDTGSEALASGLFTGARYTCTLGLLTLKPLYPSVSADLPALQLDRLP
jgi:hypothetical protein